VDLTWFKRLFKPIWIRRIQRAICKTCQGMLDPPYEQYGPEYPDLIKMNPWIPKEWHFEAIDKVFNRI